MKIQSNYHACSIIEGFDGEKHSDEERIAAFQYLIDSGAIWSFRGCLGWAARNLIALGECHE